MRRGVAVFVLAAWMTAMGAGSAAAHAGFVSSDPTDGTSLRVSPSTISIVFTETPDLGLSNVDLLDAGGAERSLGLLEAVPPLGVAAAVKETLPDGVYTVSWRVVSTEDGHVTAGAFAFAVGDAAAPTGAATEETVTRPTPGSVAAKVALYAGIALLIACAAVGLGALRGRPGRLQVVGVTGGVLGFAGAAGVLVVERRAVGVPMADLLASPTGRPYLYLVMASLLAAAAAVVAAARPAWRRLLWGAGAAAVLMAFLRASSGHAAAATPALPQELLQWVHIVAVSVWTGGLVLLVMALRDPGPAPVPEIRRYSNLALTAVVIVVLTGLVRSFTQIGGPAAALDALGTGYGTVLVIKVALAAVLIGLGAVNRRRSVPRLASGTRPLHRLARAEIAVALGIWILTATLTGLDPAGASPVAPTAPAAVLGVAEGTDFAQTTHVQLSATPGTPGTNAIEARITDPGTAETLAPDVVVVRFASVGVPDLPTVEV
ncbi:MAG: copper resistance protein CopC, partial [Actinomycetota bacterium]